MNEAYREHMTSGQKFQAQGNFSWAAREYKKALETAPGDQMQSILEMIDECKRHPNTVTRVTKRADAQRKDPPQGFMVYPVTFNDVIGYKTHKKLLMKWTRQPMEKGDKYLALKMAKSTGILMYGPPGTGKTFMGKGLSGELKVPLKVVFVSDILDKLVGGSEKNMRKVFEDATGCQPSIIFFDEVDALGASRESSNEFTSNDIKNTINEFLQQLSNLHDNKERMIIVVAATNMPWLLDPAITRSGRIEHHIFMGPPGLFDRMKILRYYLDIPNEIYRVSCNWMLLSLATIRYSQADLEKVATAAKRRILETERRVITTHDVQAVLRDRNEGVSSLDQWVLKAKETYLKRTETQVVRTGFMGWKKQKQRVEKQARLSDQEMKIYKPLINYLNRTFRWWLPLNLVRFIARGI
jgi:SpoVK/Ycf46/Vps4 family AAA+-type ATPase